MESSQAKTIDGHDVTGLQRSNCFGELFGICWKPDPRGYGITGASRWHKDGTPSYPDADYPALDPATIPDHLLTR